MEKGNKGKQAKRNSDLTLWMKVQITKKAVMTEQVDVGGLMTIAFSLIGTHSLRWRSWKPWRSASTSVLRHGHAREWAESSSKDSKEETRKHFLHCSKVKNSRQNVGNQLVMDCFADLFKPSNVAKHEGLHRLRSTHHNW